jgi:hypothetical protein
MRGGDGMISNITTAMFATPEQREWVQYAIAKQESESSEGIPIHDPSSTS